MRSLFIALCVLTSSLTLQAQDRFHVAFKGGYSLVDLSGDVILPDLGSDARTAYHMGFAIGVDLTEKLSVQPEFLYSSQGAALNYDALGGPGLNQSQEVEFTKKLHYCNIPVIAKYNVIKGLSVQAGPQFGFLLHATDEFNITTQADQPVSYSKAITTDDMNKFDFGLNFGLGYRFDFGFFVDVRYNVGLTDVYPDDSGLGSSQNRALQVSLGAFFN